MGLFRRRAAAASAGLPEAIDLDEPPVRVRLRVDARARRFTLRMTPDGAGAVLTMPPAVPEQAVRAFLAEHAGWLATTLARQPTTVTVAAGAVLPVDGTHVTVALHDKAPRIPSLDGATLAMRPGGPVGPRIERWLRARARARMEPMVMAYAAEAGRQCIGLKFADTRSRWGSCSSAGRIGLSWRLAMAPEAIQAYVAAHEVAHLVEMNHSHRYWAVLAQLMPDYATHRAWLRREGRRLHAYRFDAG